MRFVAPKSSVYCFYTTTTPDKDNEDTGIPSLEVKIDIYKDYFVGFSSAIEAIDSTTMEQNSDGSIQVYLKKDETRYLRVSYYGSHGSCGINLAYKEGFDSNFRHTHQYTISYTWKSDRAHFAYCFCDSKKLQGHVLYGSSNICLFCGGTASIGFNKLSVDDELEDGIKSIGNGSLYINGIIILSKTDYSLVQKHLEGCI